MPNQRTFGHRNGLQPPARQPMPRCPTNQPSSRTTDSPPPRANEISQEPGVLSIDEELRAWKQAREKTFQIPWRQLFVIAGVCFGAASFVLPDWVSDDLQWLLYTLAAASFYAGLRTRKSTSV